MSVGRLGLSMTEFDGILADKAIIGVTPDINATSEPIATN